MALEEYMEDAFTNNKTLENEIRGRLSYYRYYSVDILAQLGHRAAGQV